jgi:hypothetical protein
MTAEICDAGLLELGFLVDRHSTTAVATHIFIDVPDGAFRA